MRYLDILLSQIRVKRQKAVSANCVHKKIPWHLEVANSKKKKETNSWADSAS